MQNEVSTRNSNILHKPRKLLKPAQTRWLSLEQCIQRIIEQWPALELYFEKPAKNDRLISSQNIFTALKNPIFKLYFYFLSFILRKFTNFNKLFQSKTPNIHFLTNYLASTYKAFLSCYLLSTYIRSTSLHCVDLASPSNLLPLTSMNMGGKVSNFLTQSNISHLRNEIRGFLERVQLFYIEASLQIKSRFPIDYDILKSLVFLNPDTNEVIQIGSKFPNIISTSEISKLDDE